MPPDSVAVPTGLPSTENATLPVGVPAPGGTAVTVAVIVCGRTVTAVIVDALDTGTLCEAVAGEYCESPACDASMRQLPGLVNVTVEPLIMHTEDDDESMVNVTGLPDPPPVAVTG